MPKKPNATERFWSKVTKTATHWLWTGETRERGTGRFRMDKQNYQAHRITFELACGQLQGSVGVFQTCGEPSCVRPSHLQARSLGNRIEDGNGGSDAFCSHAVFATNDSLFVHPRAGPGCIECLALYPPRRLPALEPTGKD